MNAFGSSPDPVDTGNPLYKVLVVEDSSVQRMHLRSLIYASPDQRCRVFEARNGEEALQVMAGVKPDLVFTDVHMPRMNGIQLLQRMREDPASQHVPVVMVTSLNDRRTMRQVLVCGADAYLVKPYQDEAFLRVLNRQLSRLPSPGQAPAATGCWTLDEAWLRARLLAGALQSARPAQLSIEPQPLALDEEDLLMCLAELAANAHTHGAPVRPWSIQARLDLGHYVVSVCNEGPPVPPEFLDAAATSGSARGVGLALAAACAKRLGASLRWINTSGSPNIIQLVLPPAALAG